MHIIHISTELTPIAKAGGLGDVVYGLSKELHRQGHRVQILLPKYDSIHYPLLKNLKVAYRDLWSYDGPYRYNNTIWSAEVDGLSLLLLEPHHPEYFFSRGSIYGAPDDIKRFLYFSRAAMEFLFKSRLNPDVIHVHDWPTAIIPVLQEEMYSHLGIKPARTVLTLHNLEHQGRCSTDTFSQIGLRGDDFLSPEKLQDPSTPTLINLLKGGINYADAITTVSPSYEKEIKTEKGSHGLSTCLIKNEDKLEGILNGIDEDFWDPEIDPYLFSKFPTHPPFTEEKKKSIWEAKSKNKQELRKLLNLEENNRPLIACITRLVPQKSPLLIAQAFRHILESQAQCVILGSPYSEEMQTLFSSLKKEFENSSQGALILEYDEALSHLVYAASDMLIIPSLFEPCGLTQMIALRYGSIPIVRKTGGLQDTVFDIEDTSIPLEKRNGFVFEKAEQQALNKCINRALTLYQKKPKKWQELVEQGMQKDFSWKAATQKYLSMYRS